MQQETKPSQEVVINSGKGLLRAFADYVTQCEEADSFPNLAGFCRFCGMGEERFSSLRAKFPDAGDFVLTALEDEALNSRKSASLVNAYLRHRLGYGEGAGDDEEAEVIQVDPALMRDGE